MSAVLDPGKKARKAAEEARKAAEETAAQSRREQRVTNDRSLAQLQDQEQRTTATRRNPRGRRLFVDDAASKSTLA